MFNQKHQRTWEAIFPMGKRSPGVSWKDIEALLKEEGAEISQGQDFRVRIALHGRKAILHRPFSENKVEQGTLAAIRHLLEEQE